MSFFISNLSSVSISGKLTVTSSVNFTSSVRFTGSTFLSYAFINKAILNGYEGVNTFSENITDDIYTEQIYGMGQEQHDPYNSTPIDIAGKFSAPVSLDNMIPIVGANYAGYFNYKANKIRFLRRLDDYSSTTFTRYFDPVVQGDSIREGFEEWVNSYSAILPANTLRNFNLCEGCLHFHLTTVNSSYASASNFCNVTLFGKLWGSATYWNTVTTNKMWSLDVWCKFWRYGNTLRVMETNMNGTDYYLTFNLKSDTTSNPIFTYSGGTSAYSAQISPAQSFVEAYVEW